jgi:hypothetical protein
LKPLKSNQFETFEVLLAELKLPDVNITFIVIYRPPNSSLPIFFMELADLLEDTLSSGNKLVLLGDTNIHVDDKTNAAAKKIKECLSSFNLMQFIQEPTHIHGHTLDILVCDAESDLINNINIDNNGISDHHSVYWELTSQRLMEDKKTIIYRDLKNINVDNLNEDIRNSSLNQFCNYNSNVTDATSMFKYILGSLLDHHAPEKRLEVKNRINTPWYSNALREKKREVRKLEKAWRKTKDALSGFEYRYRLQELSVLAESEKKTFYKNQIVQHKGNMKMLYRTINVLTKPEQPRTLPQAASVEELCNKFVNFYGDKIDKIRVELIQHNVEENDDDVRILINCLHNFQSETEASIMEIITKMPSKTCKLDCLPTNILKKCLPSLIKFITILVNLSFLQGTFPETLKDALVIPLLKKLGLDPSIFNHFRPVSNIEFLSKVMEKAAAHQLTDYMRINHLFEDLQSSYKTGHSTETALIRIQDDMCKSIDEGNAIILLLLDLSSAFDTVDHNILIKRLENYYGIKDLALSWIKTYLTGRRQAVTIDGMRSEWKPLKCGVPQGSILGPILFTLYTQPLCDILRSKGVDFHLYADDTQIYWQFRCIRDRCDYVIAKLKIEECVQTIKTWMRNNMLKLNDGKSELLVISSRGQLNHLTPDTSIMVGGHELEAKSAVRNLGVMLDKHLSMEDNISKVMSKCFMNIKKIYRIRGFIDRNTTKILMNSLVLSHIDYCSALYKGIPNKSVKRLQRAQNAAARLIFQVDRRTDSKPLIQELNWLTVSQRIDYKCLLIGFKVINDLGPKYLSDLISMYDPVVDLRSSFNFNLNSVRCNRVTFGYRRFSVYLPPMWNSLPSDIKLAPTVQSFKKQIKEFIRNNNA